MKLCFTINQNRTLEEIRSFKPLLQNDYQAIEIFYPYDKGPTQLANYIQGIKEIKEEYPKIEIVCHLPHAYYNGIANPIFIEAGSIELMMAAARFAKTFNAKKLTLHLGNVSEMDRKEAINYAISSLKKICSYVLEFDQVVMIENMPSSIELGYSPEEILEIIKGVGLPNLKFIYDTGHGHVSEFEDLRFLYELKDYLYHLHYSDNSGLRDEHARFGVGNINFVEIEKALNKIGYQELHCMEIIYSDAKDLKEIAESFRTIVKKATLEEIAS